MRSVKIAATFTHDRRALVAVVEPQPGGLARYGQPWVPWIMRHVMSRQLIVTLAILACGLVPDRLSGDRPSRLRDSLKSNLLNRVDLERIERGYYEQIARPEPASRRPGRRAGPATARGTGGTWSVPFEDAPLVMRVDDLREVVLKPDDDTFREGRALADQLAGHARPGLRDRQTPTNFPDRARGRLDRRRLGGRRRTEVRVDSGTRPGTAARRAASGLAVEIINCAVPGHSPGQRWCHFSQVGWPMNPDMVIYESTASDVGWDERRLRYLLARGNRLGFAGLSAACWRERGSSGSAAPTITSALCGRDIGTSWPGVYQTMAADCRSVGVPIVWVLVPRVGRPNDGPTSGHLSKAAQAAGFTRIVDVTDAYDGLDPAGLAVDPDDFHPNAIGSRPAGSIGSTLR